MDHALSGAAALHEYGQRQVAQGLRPTFMSKGEGERLYRVECVRQMSYDQAMQVLQELHEFDVATRSPQNDAAWVALQNKIAQFGGSSKAWWQSDWTPAGLNIASRGHEPFPPHGDH